MAQVENQNDSKRVVVDLTMTVEEARQVIWEDAYNPRRPIGELLDAKKISYNNLAWGVNGAWKPEMRMAARTLLAYWLGRPETVEATRRFGSEVIEGSHYLEEEESDAMAQFIIYMMAGLFFAFFAIPSSLIQVLSNKTNLIPMPVAIAMNLIIALILGLWLYRKVKREFARWKYSGRGRRGEHVVVERLRGILDNRWTIFRNLHLPDRKDDIDIALVGPGGVWAVEVKAFREPVRVTDRQWERKIKRGWTRLDGNPSKQVTDNALRLKNYLDEQGAKLFVERAIALAEPQPVSNFESSQIPIWFLPTLETQAANLSTRIPPTEDEIKRICGLFKELASKQIAIEEAKYKKS